MMKVVVVHDRLAVSEEIEKIIRAAVPSAQIEFAEDGVSARQKLAQSIYDLLIIDLTLPHVKGGVADYRTADELLKELFELGSLNIPGDIIGLTQDTEALGLVNTSLGPHLMITIQEDAEGRWKRYLSDKIIYASRASITRQVSVNQHHLYDVLILTALDSEFAPYHKFFDFVDVRHFPGVLEFVFSDKAGISRRGIAYAIGKAGQARASSICQSLLVAFRPKLAIMSGFCGGVKNKVGMGDLVLFDSSYDWDYGKWGEEKDGSGNSKAVFWSRPSPINIEGTPAYRIGREIVNSNFNRSAELLDEVAHASKGMLSSFGVHLKPVASGSAVVANDDVIGRIRGLNESIIAVDMESYGFYFSCSQTAVAKPHYLCLKAVADYCNGDKGDELHEACSLISASAAIEIIKKRWEF